MINLYSFLTTLPDTSKKYLKLTEASFKKVSRSKTPIEPEAKIMTNSSKNIPSPEVFSRLKTEKSHQGELGTKKRFVQQNSNKAKAHRLLGKFSFL
jgi:hypothetical protein